MPRTASCLTATSAQERTILLSLQTQFLSYFLDNQTLAHGLVLDRQSNFAPPRAHGLCSLAATGMGFIAIALASAEPYRLLTRREAINRIRRGLDTALEKLPHTAGVLPHFVHSDTLAVAGADARSTVDTAWLVAGAMWATSFLADVHLERLAEQVFARIDWTFWIGSNGLISHGADARGRRFPCCWDRLNGETLALCVLAAGARSSRCWPAENQHRLKRFLGSAGGLRFGSADLGLFVFQYGVDLLDLTGPGCFAACLAPELALAAEANARVCRAAADRFLTYRRFWGLSAGDGPGPGVSFLRTHAQRFAAGYSARSAGDTYRAYSPSEPLDGTAHVTATVASIAHCPALVWENLCQASACSPRMRGRYGFSNVNLDRGWVGRDVVGIDAGAAVLALDNYLAQGRIRRVFQDLPAVRCGLARLATTRRTAAA
jgi:hypothetical protein